MLVEMSRVELVGLKGLREPALAFLHDLGLLEIEPARSSLVSTPDTASVKQAIRRLQKHLARLEADSSELPPVLEMGDPERYRRWVSLSLTEFEREIAALEEDVEGEWRSLDKRRRHLERDWMETQAFLNYLAAVGPLIPLLRPLERHSTALLVVEDRFAPLLAELERELGEAAGGRLALYRARAHDRQGVLLVYPQGAEQKVRSLLLQSRVKVVSVPQALEGLSPDQVAGRARRAMEALDGEREGVQRELIECAARWQPLLMAALAALADRSDELRAVEALGETERTFLVTGWMPAARVRAAYDAFEQRFRGRVTLRERAVSADERRSAPVALDNPAPVRPFETVLQLLGLPGYGTVDPTPLLALFFVAFFGLIVGDIAYGLIIAAGALMLRRRATSEMVRALSSILAYGGASAVAFGLLYGEFLGDMLYRRDLVHFIEVAGIRLPIEREHLILPLFFVSLGVGLAHIVLGLVLGVITAGRMGQRRLAAERLGEIGLLTGLALLAGVTWGWIPHLAHHTAYGLIILGSVLLLYAGGVLLGPLHVVELFRNLVSYVRLGALALAGMSLAAMANHLGSAVGNVAFGILLAVLLHIVNLAFSIISPTIHSLRLNVLEFFGGFYQPGGRPYRPFERAHFNR